MNSEFSQIGKMLILFGGVLVLVGVVLLSFGKIPFLGKLPGDIIIQKKNFTFYFPIVTSILLSLLISLLLYLFKKKARTNRALQFLMIFTSSANPLFHLPEFLLELIQRVYQQCFLFYLLKKKWEFRKHRQTVLPWIDLHKRQDN